MNEKPKLSDLQKVRNKEQADRNRIKDLRAALNAANIKARTVYLTEDEQSSFDRAIAHIGSHIKGPKSALLAYQERSAALLTKEPAALPEAPSETPTTRDLSPPGDVPDQRSARAEPNASAPDSAQPNSSIPVLDEPAVPSGSDSAEKLATAETRPVASCDEGLKSSDEPREGADDSEPSRANSAPRRKPRSDPNTIELDFEGGA